MGAEAGEGPGPAEVGGVRPVLLAWLLSVGVDLFLHAGLLADVYARPHPALLPPMDAFRRIPVGYASFLLLTAALWWLVARLDVRGGWAGARLGGMAGLVVWGALVLGLFSILTLDPVLLLAWWLGQSVELAAAGAVLGAARGGRPLKVLTRDVVLATVGLAVAAVVAQNL